tara:strand:- start:477 stop:1892 length:1416 start_codon:yes stop_codon:yes gene_type:complete
MAKITDLTTLGKTSVTADDFVLVANSARQDNKKIATADLFPSLTTVGAGAQDLFVDVSSKNNLRFKGIKSKDTKLAVTTVSNNIQLAVEEANIDLNNCSNLTSKFLKQVTLSDTTHVTGTLAVANGGTNATSFADKAVIITQDSGTDTLAAVAMDANGELLIGGTSGPAVATLTAGSNITITNGDGTIQIASAFATASADLDMQNNDIDLGTGYLSSDGNSNGIRVTGNNAYIGASGSYFNSSLLNLNGGIDFASGASYTIQIADGTSPGTLILRGQTNAATNGNGGDTDIHAGTANGNGTGGNLKLYGGDSGSGTGGSVKVITSVTGTETDALTIDGSSDVTVNAGSLIITSATEGLVHTNRGAITQANNHSTGVTLNATSGIITLAGVALAAGAEADFAVTNNTVQADSLILLTVQCPAASSATNNATLVAQLDEVGSGSFNIRLSNPGAADTSTNAHKIHFLVINNSV